jgi:hypothetical protein
MRGTLAARVARLDDGGAPFLFNGPALPYWLTHSRADATPRATYFGSDGLLKTVASATAPRIDFTPGRRPGLLVESASTNILLSSANLAAAAYIKNGVTATAAAGVDPTGGGGAAKLLETATTAFHIANAVLAGAAGAWSAAVFIKAAERAYAAVQLATDSDTKRQTVVVDLANGVVTATPSVGAPVAPSWLVAPLPGGWWRISVSATHASGNVRLAVALSDVAAPGSYSAAFPFYLGVATHGVLAWGGQLEQKSYASSFVSTAGSAVARAADALSMAARATDPLIVQTRSLADGTRARTLLNPASDVSTLADVVIEGAKLYPAGTPGASLASKLFVDGPW